MQVKAVGKFVRVQPRKVRIIADQVRNTRAEHTVHLLRYHTSKSAKELRKVLMSAMANAQENHGISPDQLKIAAITVDAGPRLKRMQARAMGRGYRIEKKMSHITVLVEDEAAVPTVKAHGTKAKPRPTFAAAKKSRTKAKTSAAGAAEVTEAPEVTAVTEAPEVTGAVETAPVAEATEEVTATAEVAESDQSEKSESSEKSDKAEEEADNEKGAS